MSPEEAAVSARAIALAFVNAGMARAAEETVRVFGPLEAGERVLRGIRNNDLYILSHPEFEQTIRDRFEALLASG